MVISKVLREMGLGCNRTMVELKTDSEHKYDADYKWCNRTMVELKKGKGWRPAGRRWRCNRTMVELKRGEERKHRRQVGRV